MRYGCNNKISRWVCQVRTWGNPQIPIFCNIFRNCMNFKTVETVLKPLKLLSFFAFLFLFFFSYFRQERVARGMIGLVWWVDKLSHSVVKSHPGRCLRLVTISRYWTEVNITWHLDFLFNFVVRLFLIYNLANNAYSIKISCCNRVIITASKAVIHIGNNYKS